MSKQLADRNYLGNSLSNDDLIRVLEETEILHVHRIVATKGGYTRYMVTNHKHARICGTDRCLKLSIVVGQVLDDEECCHD